MRAHSLLRLAALGAGLAALPACAPPAEDAAPKAVEARLDPIRNGTREPQVVPLTEGQILALGWLHTAGRPGSNFCTGTVIAPRVVATASHCTDGRRAGGIGFGVGLLPTDPAASVQVERVHEHPDLDAAILYLAEDITQLAPGLTPIAFNRDALTDEIEGEPVEAGGYGETYDRSRFGRYFARVWLERVRNTEVVVNGRGEQGICFGDSGGPVMLDFGRDTDTPDIRVLAVESWGDPSCVGQDHLTRLDIIADWIDEVSADDAPAPDPGQGCGDLDYLGECDGNTARWCGRDGQVQTRDCRRGEVCRFVDDDTGYFCAEPMDNCGEVPPVGTCSGDVVQRCRFGEVEEVDCAARGEECREDAGGAFCRAPWPPAEDPEPAEDMAPPAEDPEPDMGPMEADGGDGAPADSERGSRKTDDGCAAAPGSDAPSPAAAALLLGLLGLRRRRR